ncbi:MAG TPA: hypothetical protein VK958_11900 [Methylophilus sp.]|nr:hypothetical protein [Methylophilus sp.]HSH87939.1 hypothetical protein [Methylophilus sp.]
MKIIQATVLDHAYWIQANVIRIENIAEATKANGDDFSAIAIVSH